jgi:hypothetical protein
MSIIRVKFDRGGWAPIPNATIADRRLSLDALGILVWLLAKHDGWEVRPGVLQEEFGLGRDKVRGLLTNLELAGYLRRRQFRSENGRWDWVSEVFPTSTIDGFSGDGGAVDGSATAGKGVDLYKTEINKTEEFKTHTPKPTRPKAGVCVQANDLLSSAPAQLKPAHQRLAIRELAKLPPNQQSTIVQELIRQRSSIREPVGWIRRIVADTLEAGEFIPAAEASTPPQSRRQTCEIPGCHREAASHTSRGWRCPDHLTN